MSWAPGLAAAGWQEVSMADPLRQQEVWMADPMAQTVVPTAPTMSKVAQKAGPMARVRLATAGESKGASRAN
jgi:hypothetical protein